MRDLTHKTQSFNDRYLFHSTSSTLCTWERQLCSFKAFPFLNIRHDDHKANGSGRLYWGILFAMFPCFLFQRDFGAWSTSEGCLFRFVVFLEAKRKAWVFTATSYYITSNRLGLHGGLKPREHWDIGVFFYTPQEHESARAFLADWPFV